MKSAQFQEHAAVEERHWWFTARRIILGALLGAVAAPDQGIAVADVGCGTGGNAAAFAAHYRVLGIDPSPEAIALARARFPGVTFVQSDDPGVARVHLADGGVLLMTDVLEHVEDDRALLARAVDAVPSGGHLLLTVPADAELWSQHDVAFGHYRRYASAEFRALWDNLPVTTRLLSPYNSRMRSAIAMVRRFSGHAGDDLSLPTGPINGVLRRIFAGESAAIRAAIDTGTAPYARGVSLVALLRKS